MTLTGTNGILLSKAEQSILDALGGRAWQAADFTDAALATARTDWLRLRTAAGFKGAGRWFTTSSTNPKMAKSGLVTIGVTLHSSLRALAVWNGLEADVQMAIAGAVGSTVEGVTLSLRSTVCPRSTPGCVAACATSQSANSNLGRTDVSRLTRTLFHLHRPASAFALTADGLRQMHARLGDKCRWRVNVSDDVRWEYLAPGLFRFGVPGYSYTKWSPAERPEVPGLSVVYSATERTSDETIVELVSKSHRVAVVFDVKAADLPRVWNGVAVSDGNRTDDLYEHEAGSIVGLAAKAPTKAMKEAMRRSGFSRAA